MSGRRRVGVDISARALFAAALSTLVASAVSGASAMRVSAAEAPYETRNRALASVSSMPSAALAQVVMSNCSAALTLTSACYDDMNTKIYDYLFCVGSTTARSCPRNPTVIDWEKPMEGTRVDASGLGIERVVMPADATTSRLVINDNKLRKITFWGRHELNIANNRFTSFDDVELPSGVERLIVSGNALGRITLSSEMNILTFLDATNTSLVEIDAVRATELLTLVVAHNQIANVSNITLPARLRSIDLAHNAIADWRAFTPPSSLRELNASNNGATQFLQGNWSELAPKLEVVNFSSNSLTTIRGVTWPDTLRELDLRGNPLKVVEIFDANLPTFRQLKTLLVPDSVTSTANESCGNGTAHRVANGVTVCVVPSATVPSTTSGDDASPTPAAVDPRDETLASPSSSSLLHVVIGIAVGVGFVVVLVVGVMLRRPHRASQSDAEKPGKIPTTTQARTSTPSSTAVTKALSALRVEDTLVASHIHATDATEMRVIDDSGATRTTLVRIGENVLVRKQVREQQSEPTDRAMLALAREIRAAAPLEHARIVPFRGFTCTSVRDLALYTEYMANGSLASLLKLHRANKQHHTTFPWVAASSNTSDAARLDFAIDVAEALMYLHSFEPPVVHGNIRAKHVLIDAQWRARVRSVGHRIERDDFDRVQRGDVAWLAPEILRDTSRPKSALEPDDREEAGHIEQDGYSPASDVYAFGVFLAELDACGAHPFDHLIEQRTNTQLASEIVRRELKPVFHGDFCPDRVKSLAAWCLASDPDARPTTMQVYYELTQLRKQLRRPQESQKQAKHISV